MGIFVIYFYRKSLLSSPAAAMKPYDIVRPTEMGFLDIVWEVEEVKVKLPSVVSGYFYSERTGEK